MIARTADRGQTGVCHGVAEIRVTYFLPLACTNPAEDMVERHNHPGKMARKKGPIGLTVGGDCDDDCVLEYQKVSGTAARQERIKRAGTHGLEVRSDADCRGEIQRLSARLFHYHHGLAFATVVRACPQDAQSVAVEGGWTTDRSNS